MSLPYPGLQLGALLLVPLENESGEVPPLVRIPSKFSRLVFQIKCCKILCAIF